MRDIYGVEASASLAGRITDKIMPGDRRLAVAPLVQHLPGSLL